MFGTQNDSSKQDTPLVNDQTFNDMNNGTGGSSPSAPSLVSPTTSPSAPTTTMTPITPTQPATSTAPSLSLPSPATTLTPTPTPAPTVQTSPESFGLSAAPAPVQDDELMGIKHEALSELSPLVSHIEQTPTEKFRTLMMMIQGADDKTLIKPAYEAAKAIEDEKERAQALLDIVNEINYFTQPKDPAVQPPM